MILGAGKQQEQIFLVVSIHIVIVNVAIGVTIVIIPVIILFNRSAHSAGPEKRKRNWNNILLCDKLGKDSKI